MKDERVLFKFVANEYLHDLLQGKLYMNALSYFSHRGGYSYSSYSGGRFEAKHILFVCAAMHPQGRAS
jgi:hypothetical protein